MKKLLLITLLLTTFIQTQASDIQDSTQLSNSKVYKFFTSPKYIISPFAFYMPETNLVIGAGIKHFYDFGSENDSLTRVSNIAASVQYSLNGQFLIRSHYDLFSNHEKYYVTGYLGYSRFPMTFYGIGNNIDMEKHESVSFDYLRFDNLTYRKVGQHSFAGLGWRYMKMFNVKMKENGMLSSNEVAGNYGSTVSGINISYLLDSRDNILTPSKGVFAQLTYSIHSKTTASSHAFNRWQFDARYFIKPFKKREDVLAFQGYGFLSSGDVPFNELAQMGGDMIMRGYFQGSFRDKNLLALQAEYRLQVLKRWGVVGFAGTGGISDAMGKFDLGNTKPSYGGGLRFKINRKENVNLRMDYGFGNGQQNIYFFIAEAF
ncbi:BamA/TamA family outer membrane protein [Arcicella sp. LKC2W]|uniref:BamA/TamA family outer membrane protein n=1 Tax=Arcicella sp. LKC2W TaxID=2984198 RepID=UPI002B21EFCE|nr:BamA/TamA family outer membrane protein [Arcicella sp. LKC2W]MEA5459957.1 BamA/TamA family outer membrane protein [Arcicella sp. LKC2W]